MSAITNRYEQLNPIIAYEKPWHIVEIGTWTGDRAIQLCAEAIKHRDKLLYEGYDLFQYATKETDKKELNVKKHATLSAVDMRLNAFKVKARNMHIEFDYELHAGDTNTTLEPTVADFVWLDGGHSIETIQSDFDNLKFSKCIVLDDYYVKDEQGKCPDTQKYGCNQLVHSLDESKWEVKILPKKDRVSGGGMVQIVVVKQR